MNSGAKGVVLGIAVALVFTLCVTLAAHAQETSGTPGEGDEAVTGVGGVPTFGGPSSVGVQVESDDKRKKSLYRFEGLGRKLQPYYDFKARVNEKYGLALGADYNLLYQGASESLGEDHAMGGVLRLFGTWTVLGRDSGNPGSLTYKVENRHRLGTNIAPKQLAGEVGYAGLTAIPFSDAGWILTNLYWQQAFNENSQAFVAGIVDTTDYVGVYGLVNPWTNFSNLAFSTDPTIPVPNQGLGAAVRAFFADNYYVVAGLADANGDPGDPLDSFDSFFGDREYFKHVEVGWLGSRKSFSDNIHLTAWQADERESAQVADGWGAAFSFSRKLDDRWLPFVRVGYADGGGTLLERSVSAGLAYFRKTRSDVLGLGLNWGRPNEETFGQGLDDQYTVEFYYRLQLSQHTAVTPGLQLLINPALNPDEDQVWVFGIRARLAF